MKFLFADWRGVGIYGLDWRHFYPAPPAINDYLRARNQLLAQRIGELNLQSLEVLTPQQLAAHQTQACDLVARARRRSWSSTSARPMFKTSKPCRRRRMRLGRQYQPQTQQPRSKRKFTPARYDDFQCSSRGRQPSPLARHADRERAGYCARPRPHARRVSFVGVLASAPAACTRVSIIIRRQAGQSKRRPTVWCLSACIAMITASCSSATAMASIRVTRISRVSLTALSKVRVCVRAKLGLTGNTAGYQIPIHLRYELLLGDYANPKKSSASCCAHRSSISPARASRSALSTHATPRAALARRRLGDATVFLSATMHRCRSAPTPAR